MDALRITGGQTLRGSVRASGAKNAALPILAASILAEGSVLLDNVPNVADVRTALALLRSLGMSVEWTIAGLVRIATADSEPTRAPSCLVSKMRASVCVLGPLLARRGRAVLALPGGCVIGSRPIDLHLAALTKLGAEIRLQGRYIFAKARRLRGAKVCMAGPRGPSVTGTANVLSAAVLAEGRTVITGAAREPEIVDLANFLHRLGARISGQGTPTICIDGVQQIGMTRPVPYRIIPDRIEAATLLMAAAITSGSITLTDVLPEHLSAILEVLHEMGLVIEIGDRLVRLVASSRMRASRVTACPYPGVPTDVQPQLTALTCLARGTSRIGDSVFPDRFRHVAALRKMGAKIHLQSGAAVVQGGSRLFGSEVGATDLRSAAALVLAGLAADGESVVYGMHHLRRGYEVLADKLRRLGAEVEHYPAIKLGRSTRERLVDAAGFAAR